MKISGLGLSLPPLRNTWQRPRYRTSQLPEDSPNGMDLSSGAPHIGDLKQGAGISAHAQRRMDPCFAFTKADAAYLVSLLLCRVLLLQEMGVLVLPTMVHACAQNRKPVNQDCEPPCRFSFVQRCTVEFQTSGMLVLTMCRVACGCLAPAGAVLAHALS